MALFQTLLVCLSGKNILDLLEFKFYLSQRWAGLVKAVKVGLDPYLKVIFHLLEFLLV
jgi:hypothetical protein